MIDDTPYIIVDNQKIQPISRSSRPDGAAGDNGKRQEQNFGVVDRVTLSKEGLEKSRQHVQDVDQLADLEKQANRLGHRQPPMLTYSPQGRR